MTLKLSPRTQAVVEKLFVVAEQPNVIKLLVEECGNNLPFCKESDEYKMDRIRFAVLKISNGDPLKFLEALKLAKQDWRDVLVWAEFGSDLDAHNKWADEKIDLFHQ